MTGTSASPSAGVGTAPGSDGGRSRVVVAEDDAPLRTLLRMVVSRDDRLEVVGEAADGREALQLVDEHDPDLLLLDLSMPEVDGLEVLRKLGACQRPRIVVLTALGDALDEDDMEATVLELGAARYLSKATAFDGLTDHLVQVLE